MSDLTPSTAQLPSGGVDTDFMRPVPPDHLPAAARRWCLFALRHLLPLEVRLRSARWPAWIFSVAKHNAKRQRGDKQAAHARDVMADQSDDKDLFSSQSALATVGGGGACKTETAVRGHCVWGALRATAFFFFKPKPRVNIKGFMTKPMGARLQSRCFSTAGSVQRERVKKNKNIQRQQIAEQWVNKDTQWKHNRSAALRRRQTNEHGSLLCQQILQPLITRVEIRTELCVGNFLPLFFWGRVWGGGRGGTHCTKIVSAELQKSGL